MAKEMKKGTVMLSMFGAVGLLATIGVIMWARSDAGVIDVATTISNSNQATVNAGGTGEVVPPPPSAFTNMENGGLVPQESSSAPTPESTPEPANGEGAAPSDETATSTGDETGDTQSNQDQVEPEPQSTPAE